MAHKFHAVSQTVDGHKFPSKAEARRYGELKLLERAGQIRQLELQPRFPISIDGTIVCHVVPDFAYFEGNARVVEDVKGGKATRTRIYSLKKKLFCASYRGIEHREIG